MRIDKYLWCVRLYKTRSVAAKAVEKGEVQINGAVVKKPSKEVKIDQTFAIRVQPIWRTFKALDIPKSRVGAKLVPDLIIETTSEEETKLLAAVQRQNNELRQKGMLGRPTKKNRRDMEGFWEEF